MRRGVVAAVALSLLLSATAMGSSTCMGYPAMTYRITPDGTPLLNEQGQLRMRWFLMRKQHTNPVLYPKQIICEVFEETFLIAQEGGKDVSASGTRSSAP